MNKLFVYLTLAGSLAFADASYAATSCNLPAKHKVKKAHKAVVRTTTVRHTRKTAAATSMNTTIIPSCSSNTVFLLPDSDSLTSGFTSTPLTSNGMLGGYDNRMFNGNAVVIDLSTPGGLPVRNYTGATVGGFSSSDYQPTDFLDLNTSTSSRPIVGSTSSTLQSANPYYHSYQQGSTNVTVGGFSVSKPLDSRYTLLKNNSTTYCGPEQTLGSMSTSSSSSMQSDLKGVDQTAGYGVSPRAGSMPTQFGPDNRQANQDQSR